MFKRSLNYTTFLQWYICLCDYSAVSEVQIQQEKISYKFLKERWKKEIDY